MAGHGSPPPPDKADHPNRKVGRGGSLPGRKLPARLNEMETLLAAKLRRADPEDEEYASSGAMYYPRGG